MQVALAKALLQLPLIDPVVDSPLERIIRGAHVARDATLAAMDAEREQGVPCDFLEPREALHQFVKITKQGLAILQNKKLATHPHTQYFSNLDICARLTQHVV